jgi:hypothetical protein
MKDIGKIALVSRAPGNHFKLYESALTHAPSSQHRLFERLFPRPISGRWGSFSAAILLLNELGQETSGS